MSNVTYRKVRTPARVVDSEADVDIDVDIDADEYDDDEPVEQVRREFRDAPIEERGGLFSTPARTVTLIASIGLVVALFAMVMTLLASRNTPPVPQSNTSGPGVEVSVITKANLGGADEAPKKDFKAPNFEWNDMLTGKPMRVANLGKPVMVNFWGTWCPPCRAEMPVMQKLYNQYKGQIEFVGVSMGPRDNAPGVKSFVNNAPYNWTFVQDDDYSVANRYEVQAVPSSFFIGSDGVIKAVHVGAVNESQLQAYLQQVK